MRKQFNDGKDKDENLIVDYQLQQYRLMPYLSNNLAMSSAFNFCIQIYSEILPTMKKNPECGEGAEFHAILCCLKSLSTWYGRDSIQSCRECVGGQGYSSYSGLPRIRAGDDIQVTWEGDNYVIIQQTAKFILKQYQKALKGESKHFTSLQGLALSPEDIPPAAFSSLEDLDNPDTVYQLLTNKMNAYLHRSVTALAANSAKTENLMQAWNESQVFALQDLAKSFGERWVAAQFRATIEAKSKCPETKHHLTNLWKLYALHKVQNDLSILQEGCLNTAQAQLVRQKVLDLCKEVSKASLSIVEAIAPPDKMLGSNIAPSDGQLYEHLLEAVHTNPGVYKQPSWLPELQKLKNNNF